MSGVAGNRNVPGRFPLKSTDVREITVLYINIPKKSSKTIEVHNRAVLDPMFKKYQDKYVPATGSVDAEYDKDFLYCTLTNYDDCDVELIIRIV